jgi:hypothetical protein
MSTHKFVRRLKAGAAGLLGAGALAGIAVAAVPSGAAVSSHVAFTANSAGYQTPQSGWRFRDAHDTVYLRSATEVNGVSLSTGLSNPSNGDFAKITLSGTGTGYILSASVDASHTVPGAFSSDLVIAPNDTVSFDVYYNTTSRYLHFTVADQTTGISREVTVHYGFASWYTPQFLVTDTNAESQAVVGATAVELANITLASQTSYDVTRGTLDSPWNTQPVEGGAPGALTAFPTAIAATGREFKAYAYLAS